MCVTSRCLFHLMTLLKLTFVFMLCSNASIGSLRGTCAKTHNYTVAGNRLVPDQAIGYNGAPCAPKPDACELRTFIYSKAAPAEENVKLENHLQPIRRPEYLAQCINCRLILGGFCCFSTPFLGELTGALSQRIRSHKLRYAKIKFIWRVSHFHITSTSTWWCNLWCNLWHNVSRCFSFNLSFFLLSSFLSFSLTHTQKGYKTYDISI